MKKIVYKSKEFSVENEDMVVNGKPMLLSRIILKDVAVIIPVLPDGKIVLEKNYRPVIKRRIYELPAGKLNVGESPIACAKRELEEETGFRAGHMKFLFRGYASPGRATYMAYCYLATGLTRGRLHRDPHEDIEIVTMSLRDALKMIDTGRIIDMKSIAGLLYYWKHFS